MYIICIPIRALKLRNIKASKLKGLVSGVYTPTGLLSRLLKSHGSNILSVETIVLTTNGEPVIASYNFKIYLVLTSGELEHSANNETLLLPSIASRSMRVVMSNSSCSTYNN